MTAGAATVAYGGTVVTVSAAKFGDDFDKMQAASKAENRTSGTGNSPTNADSDKITQEAIEKGAGITKSGGKVIATESANDVNANFTKIGYKPPYKPGTQTTIIELTQNTKVGEFVRVYDNANSNQVGGWVMKADDIAGLTPQQIQNKFALPTTPTHVTDVIFESGTRLRTGIANGLFGFDGGGVQFELMGQRAGQFTNGRLLP